MANIFKSMGYLFDGFSLIFKPKIRRFVIIPLLINLILFVLMFFLLMTFMKSFNEWFLTYLPSWLAFLSTILWLFFFICFFLFFIYAFVFFANVIAAPFNGLLSEKVELYLRSKHLQKKSHSVSVLQDFPRMMGRQFAIIGYYLPRIALLFVLFFVPVIQVFAAFFWFLFNAWFMALTYFDYPSDNAKVSFKDLRLWCSKNSMLTMPFGILVLFLSMIPFVNFFVMPAAVAGATKCWVEENEHAKKESP